MKTYTLNEFFIRITLILLFLFAFIILASMQIITQNYKSMIISNSQETLSLYTVNLERYLSEIEQYSRDINSNYTIQNHMRAYLNEPETYEGYVARKELESTLMSTTLNRSSISAAYFIFSNDNKLSILAGYSGKPSAQFIDFARKKALESKDGAIWLIDPDDSDVVVYAKVMKSTTYPTSVYSEYGVLVLALNNSVLLYSQKPYDGLYKTAMLCFVNDSLFNKNDQLLDEAEILRLLDTVSEDTVIMQKVQDGYIHSAPSTVNGWRFVNLISFEPLTRRINETRLTLALSLLLLVSLLSFMFIHLSKKICRPLVSISKSMKDTDAGNFQKLILPQKQKMISEIQELSSSYNNMIDEINRLINEVYTKQLAISETKYKMLQKQINPHFIYNTLETIRWKAVTDNDMQLAEMTVSLSNLLRASIKKDDIITIQEELQIARDYITIQRIRFESRLVCSIDSNPLFYPYLIPKMTIQPLLENAIRHNIEKYDGDCHIQIMFREENGCIVILVCDDGKHADVPYINRIIRGEIQNENHSFGLTNVHTRIRLSFGPEYGIQAMEPIEYTGNEDGVCMQIKLPLSTEKK